MTKQVVLLRVGIDSGCGGIQGPLFKDGLFDFVCIPDNKRVSVHTYRTVFEKQKEDLVLVQGGLGSQLFKKAHQISTEGKDRAGKPLKVLSPTIQKVFGSFGGHVSIQRSPPRWVEPGFVDKAIRFVKELE